MMVAVIDSGVLADLQPHVTAAHSFPSDGSPTATVLPDRLGHGDALARLILQAAPTARLINAQVFRQRAVTTAPQIAAALDWSVEQGANLCLFSLGLRQDRPILRDACQRAMDRGCTIIASAPARGQPVFPAAYAGVIRASGDARCQAGQISWIPDGFAEFCTSPQSHDPSMAGASFAAARLTGLIAQAIIQGDCPQTHIRDYLQHNACFIGRELRQSLQSTVA